MPGISPLVASSRKQMRHRPNFLINPLLRPQRQQRLAILVEYKGFFCDLITFALLAIIVMFNYYHYYLLSPQKESQAGKVK